MKRLRKKIKKIIYSHNGLPGRDREEYLNEMAGLILSELSSPEIAQLKHQNLNALILELSQEIAEEIL